MQVFDLSPKISASFKDSPDRKVQLYKAGFSGTWVKVEGESGSQYRHVSEFDEEAQRAVKRQAEEKRRVEAMHGATRPQRVRHQSVGT